MRGKATNETSILEFNESLAMKFSRIHTKTKKEVGSTKISEVCSYRYILRFSIYRGLSPFKIIVANEVLGWGIPGRLNMYPGGDWHHGKGEQPKTYSKRYIITLSIGLRNFFPFIDGPLALKIF